MSGTMRAGLVFGLASVAAFLGALLIPIPCLNVILALASVIALGWGAGYTAAKTTGAGPGQGAGRGATAGAIGGAISLVGLAVALFIIVNIPAVQDRIALIYQQVLEQNPELVTPGVDPTLVGRTAGVVLGFFCGIINFILMVIGGLVGGVMWKGAPGTATAGTPGHEPPSSGSPYYPPPSTGDQATRSSEGGVRVYDTDDPNRPH